MQLHHSARHTGLPGEGTPLPPNLRQLDHNIPGSNNLAGLPPPVQNATETLNRLTSGQFLDPLFTGGPTSLVQSCSLAPGCLLGPGASTSPRYACCRCMTTSESTRDAWSCQLACMHPHRVAPEGEVACRYRASGRQMPAARRQAQAFFVPTDVWGSPKGRRFRGAGSTTALVTPSGARARGN